jgi:hypothetical protein
MWGEGGGCLLQQLDERIYSCNAHGFLDLGHKTDDKMDEVGSIAELDVEGVIHAVKSCRIRRHTAWGELQ